MYYSILTNWRKTHTSSAVKQRYNQKTYTAVTAMLPKELAAQFKTKCAEAGVSQASVIKAAVEAYLGTAVEETVACDRERW